MIRRLALALALTVVCAACKSDNASPMTHGAHNDPADGKTHADAPPGTTRPQTSSDPTGTYSGSSGRSGGVQSDTALAGTQTGGSTEQSGGTASGASGTGAAGGGGTTTGGQ